MQYFFFFLAILLVLVSNNRTSGQYFPPQHHQFILQQQQQQQGPYGAFGNNGPRFFPGYFPPPPDYFDSYFGQRQVVPPYQPFAGGGSFTRGIEQGMQAGFSGFPSPLGGVGAGGRGNFPPFGPSPNHGVYGGGFGGAGGPFQQNSFGPQHIVHATVTDKDNFQPQGCGWDGLSHSCNDLLGLCRGGCRDFSSGTVTHDCRCVPIGYAVLYNGFHNSSRGFGGKKKK